jgi:rhodanese-related sulfurtransferase
MDAANSVSNSQLRSSLSAIPPPQLLDARRGPAFAANPVVIPGAVRCPPEEVAAVASKLEPWRPVIVYCAHGQDVGRGAALLLRERGFDARFLEGGLEAWRESGGAIEPHRAPTRWVTRERPKIDRIACPWLVRRFIDPAAEFFYVPTADVRAFARARGATPYDIPDVEYSHVGPACSFDAFIRRHALADPALDRLATIVRGADTAALDLAPQSPGLLAASLGLSRIFADDQSMLRWGMLVYDALYAWCNDACDETHSWNPAPLRATAT